MTVGKTIIFQIRRIDPMATFAWGMKNAVYMSDGFKFKTSGLVKWKGYVYIKYDYGSDLYNVEFAKIRKYEWKTQKTVEGVYAEDLVRVIDEQVG